MAPPESPTSPPSGTGCAAPAVPVFAGAKVPLTTLTRRADFLAAARARRQVTQGFILQARQRGDDADTIRIGYTCSKKVGNAVARNRAKRRLREAARAVLPVHGQPGWDYVLIGRQGETARRPFADMLDDLRAALARLHGGTRT